MSRAPFQVLVFLHRKGKGGSEYLLLRRADMGVWQGVAGGGEKDETPKEAAIREVAEETGIELNGLIDLESASMISVMDVVGEPLWGNDTTEIPEHAFCAVMPVSAQVVLSAEHMEYAWCSKDEALDLLEWESNKHALFKVASIYEGN